MPNGNYSTEHCCSRGGTYVRTTSSGSHRNKLLCFFNQSKLHLESWEQEAPARASAGHASSALQKTAMMSTGYRCKATCLNMVATLFPHMTLWGEKNPPPLITWLFTVSSPSQLPRGGKTQHTDHHSWITFWVLCACVSCSTPRGKMWKHMGPAYPVRYIHCKHPSSPPTRLIHPLYIQTTPFLLETSIPPTPRIPRTPRCLHQPPGS